MEHVVHCCVWVLGGKLNGMTFAIPLITALQTICTFLKDSIQYKSAIKLTICLSNSFEISSDRLEISSADSFDCSWNNVRSTHVGLLHLITSG